MFVPLRRLAAFWLALVFLLATAGEGYGYAHCAHHNPEAARGAAAGTAGHGAHAEVAPSPEHPEHSAPCSCLGTCQVGGGGAVMLAGAPAGAVVSVQTVLAARPPLPAHRSLLPRLLPYLLPYAQAPPVVG